MQGIQIHCTYYVHSGCIKYLQVDILSSTWPLLKDAVHVDSPSEGGPPRGQLGDARVEDGEVHESVGSEEKVGGDHGDRVQSAEQIWVSFNYKLEGKFSKRPAALNNM